MNITLSADAQTVEKARMAAQRMGKSLNQAVRDYLEQLAGSADRSAGLRSQLSLRRHQEQKARTTQAHRPEYRLHAGAGGHT